MKTSSGGTEPKRFQNDAIKKIHKVVIGGPDSLMVSVMSTRSHIKLRRAVINSTADSEDIDAVGETVVSCAGGQQVSRDA